MFLSWMGLLGEILAVPFLLHYLCMALALFLIARECRVALRWLAWLPVGQDYVLGAIADSIGGGDRFFGNRPSCYRHILACVSIVELFGAGLTLLLAQRGAGFPQALRGATQGRLLPTVAEVASFAVSVVTIYVLYKIFLFYCPKRAALDTLLCVFLPFVEPVLLLVEYGVRRHRRGDKRFF